MVVPSIWKTRPLRSSSSLLGNKMPTIFESTMIETNPKSKVTVPTQSSLNQHFPPLFYETFVGVFIALPTQKKQNNILIQQTLVFQSYRLKFGILSVWFLRFSHDTSSHPGVGQPWETPWILGGILSSFTVSPPHGVKKASSFKRPSPSTSDNLEMFFFLAKQPNGWKEP